MLLEEVTDVYMPLAKLLERGSLPGREVDGRRRRATHDLCPFGPRG